MKIKLSQITLLCFIMSISSVAIAEISIIVHPDNAMASIDKSAASKIFLGKSKKFPGGGKAKPMDQGSGASRKAFHSVITKKNAAKLKAYWSRMVFTGKAQPPKEVADDAEVIAKVASDLKAIGYVDSSSVTDSVKVVLKIP